MLDEPTNHLDMLSVGILANALQKYEGTYLVVSHDRDFIDKIANKIWYIEDFQIKEYPGTYSEYNTWRSEKEAKELQDKQSNSGKSNQKSKKKEEKPKKVQLNREQQKEFSRQLSKAKKAVAELERQIETLEKEKKNLEAEMAKPAVYGNPDLLFEATQKYDKVKSDLEQANEDWTEKAMELEELG
jgi:ATP-binding cassette subfamily F protein 3